jgi:hypothetical protein
MTAKGRIKDAPFFIATILNSSDHFLSASGLLLGLGAAGSADFVSPEDAAGDGVAGKFAGVAAGAAPVSFPPVDLCE